MTPHRSPCSSACLQSPELTPHRPGAYQQVAERAVKGPDTFTTPVTLLGTSYSTVLRVMLTITWHCYTSACIPSPSSHFYVTKRPSTIRQHRFHRLRLLLKAPSPQMKLLDLEKFTPYSQSTVTISLRTVTISPFKVFTSQS